MDGRPVRAGGQPGASRRADRRARPTKFRRWLTAEEAQAFVSRLRTGATLIGDPPMAAPSTPDPDDDYLVALAQKAGANCLVSGDGDLTGLADSQPPVFTPRAFFDSLED